MKPIEVDVETSPRRISILFYDEEEAMSFVVARLLYGDIIFIHIRKNTQVSYHFLTAKEAREYANLLTLLADTAEMVSRTITTPEDFGKEWAARLVDGVVVLEEVI